MRASLWAVAVTAAGVPRRLFIRRKYWPRYDWLPWRASAAMRSATVKRLLTFRVPADKIRPTLMRLSGQSPSQEANAAAAANLLRSGPTSVSRT